MVLLERRSILHSRQVSRVRFLQLLDRCLLFVDLLLELLAARLQTRLFALESVDDVVVPVVEVLLHNLHLFLMRVDQLRLRLVQLDVLTCERIRMTDERGVTPEDLRYNRSISVRYIFFTSSMSWADVLG